MTSAEDTRLASSATKPGSHDARIPLLVMIPLAVVVLAVMFWGFETHTRAEVIQGSFSVPDQVRTVLVEIDVGSVTLSAGERGEVSFTGRTLLATTTKELLDRAGAVPITLEPVDDGDPSTLVLRETPMPEGFAPPSPIDGSGAQEPQPGTPVLVTELDAILSVPPDLPVRIVVRQGNLKVDYRRALTDIRTGSGAVVVTSVEAELEVENGNGEILVDKHLGPLTLRGNGLVRVSLAQIRGPVDIVNEKGEVGIFLPNDGVFRLSARAPASQVRNEFGLPKVSIGPAGSKVEGEVGSGGPLIGVEAKAGTVTVAKNK